MLQIGNLQVIGAHVVNNTRFQYLRNRAAQTPASAAPTLVVQGSFLGGGSPLGASDDRRDRFELEEDRLYRCRESTSSTSAHGCAWRARVTALPLTSTASTPSPRWTRTGRRSPDLPLGRRQRRSPQLAAARSSSPLTAGTPSVAVTRADVGGYVQDDWMLAKHFTLSGGLRFESQSGISDHADFAPRLGFSWAIGRRRTENPRFTLRSGVGIFYDRFELTNLMNAARQNGVLERQYVINQPQFYPAIPPESQLGAQTTPTIFRPLPPAASPPACARRAPSKSTTELQYNFGHQNYVSIAYLGSRTEHSFVQRNINAPLPGTYNPSDPASGGAPQRNTAEHQPVLLRRLGNYNSVYANLGLVVTRRVQLFGYALERSLHNNAERSTIGAPSNPYDLHSDYSRGTTSHFFGYLYALATLPGALQLAADLQARSSTPFNITVPTDLNGDAQFTDRPASRPTSAARVSSAPASATSTPPQSPARPSFLATTATAPPSWRSTPR